MTFHLFQNINNLLKNKLLITIPRLKVLFKICPTQIYQTVFFVHIECVSHHNNYNYNINKWFDLDLYSEIFWHDMYLARR